MTVNNFPDLYSSTAPVIDIWTRLKADSRPIVLYGTGNGADRVIDILERENIKISGIFSSAAFVRDRFFRGYRVESFEALRGRYPDMLVLMCFGSAREEVLANVREIGKTNEISAPDVPVYGENVFTSDFFISHREELLEVRSHLCDEKSLETLDRLVHFKLTGEIADLFACEYKNDGIADIRDGCTFLDLGAYNGDTATAFYEKHRPAKIIAVEPDRRNFRKLRENTAHINNITFYNALVSDRDGTVYLDSNKGRGAHESGEGRLEAEAVTIDTVIKKEQPPENGQLVIKFDVEGNELKALEGAREAIRKYKPVMFISCYHRSEDYFTLPLKVLELCPEYKVFMRHYKGIPAWETEFIFFV